MRRSWKDLGAFLFVTTALLAIAACDPGGGAPRFDFLDTQDDTNTPADTSDVPTPSDILPDGTDTSENDGHSPQVDADATTDAQDGASPPPPDIVDNCPASPYDDYRVALGVRTSYSRGDPSPALRQWSDRARRSTPYRTLLLADQHQRGPSAEAQRQFSDANPDAAIQPVRKLETRFDEFETEGASARIEQVSLINEPDMLSEGGIRLFGAINGFAAATYQSPTGFAYSDQTLRLRVRVKVLGLPDDSRVTVEAEFLAGNNRKTLTWVLAYSGVPGAGTILDIPVGETFTELLLPLKDAIIERPDAGLIYWNESSLRTVRVRVQGRAHAVFDQVWVEADAWYDGFIAETQAHSDARLTMVPGVEVGLAPPLGQWTCVAPTRLPTTERTMGNGLMADLVADGCFVVASRPRSSREEIPDSTVVQAHAVEVWHPAHPEGYDIDPAWWDTLLVWRGPRPALAATFARNLWELTGTSPHNVVLASSAQQTDILEGLRAGRLYMTDHSMLSVEFFAKTTDCRRAEIGGFLPDADWLFAKVECPAGPNEAVAEARIIRMEVPRGQRYVYELEDAAAGDWLHTAGWSASFARLEARCEHGARVYTNPIWFIAAP